MCAYRTPILDYVTFVLVIKLLKTHSQYEQFRAIQVLSEELRGRMFCVLSVWLESGYWHFIYVIKYERLNYTEL